MNKVKIKVAEIYGAPTAEGVAGVVTFDADDLPDELRLPDKSWLAKRWRKWKAYERVWNDVCNAHDADDRDSVKAKLTALIDPVDFIQFLLEFYSESSNTSKAGGDTKSAMIKPLRQRARRLFGEKKQALRLQGKSYSQSQFATSHRKELEARDAIRMAQIQELQSELDRINADIKLGGLTASELKLKREKKRSLEEDIRIKPILPSVKTIEGWLAGL